MMRPAPAAPVTLPIASARKASPIAEYQLDFEVPRPGRYRWVARVLNDDDARVADGPVAFDPALGVWWQAMLVDAETGEDLGCPLLPTSLGVTAREA